MSRSRIEDVGLAAQKAVERVGEIPTNLHHRTRRMTARESDFRQCALFDSKTAR